MLIPPELLRFTESEKSKTRAANLRPRQQGRRLLTGTEVASGHAVERHIRKLEDELQPGQNVGMNSIVRQSDDHMRNLIFAENLRRGGRIAVRRRVEAVDFAKPPFSTDR